MNRKSKNIFIYIFLVFTIMLILRYVFSQRNMPEKFNNITQNDNTFLEKCFDKKTLNSFKKYHKIANTIKIPNGIVFSTPNQYINEIPQISWNGVFLNNLCIEPKMRNKGLGTKLVLMVIDKARKSGKDHVILQVLKKNIPAINIYKKLGFIKYLESVNKDGEEVLIFVYYL